MSLIVLWVSGGCHFGEGCSPAVYTELQVSELSEVASSRLSMSFLTLILWHYQFLSGEFPRDYHLPEGSKDMFGFRIPSEASQDWERRGGSWG